MSEFDRINEETEKLRAETERLAKHNDGVYHAIAIIIALVALFISLWKLWM